MKWLLILLLFIYADATLAQQHPVIQINDSLTAHRYEFSALAKWRNTIVLVPQNRRNVIDSIYFIDTSEIAASLNNNAYVKHTAFYIDDLTHKGPRKDSLLINKKLLLTNYDGFEAAVVKNDTIFFSLESDTSFCYLIKGIINPAKKTIHILEDTQHITNTYNINNAGYESLALLPHKNQLLAFFECNKDTINARAFMFSPSLKTKAKPLKWAQPLYFRLTDIYALNDSELLGINRLFTAPTYTRERDDYLKDVDTTKVKQQLTNGASLDYCFDQLVKITIRKNKLYWQPAAFISLNIVDNYEGIVPFNKGALMVVDGEPGNVICKLVYIPLN